MLRTRYCLRVIPGGRHAAAPSRSLSVGGRKSSAVTAPPVTSRMRVATSRPGHDGESEQSKVTYEGATPIDLAKSCRLVPVSFSHAPSLLIDTHYSAWLKFSQDENFSRALWTAESVSKTLAAMGKRVTTHFKKPKGLPLLRKWRKHRNLTQEQLASRMIELLPEDSITNTSISQLENGKQGYSQITLEALAETLNCQAGELLMRDPNVPDANGLLATMKPDTRRQALRMLRSLAEGDREEQAA